MTDSNAIEAQGLVKRFGDVLALAGVDLCLPVGHVLGLLGPNGAGKTTAVRILTTLVVPDAGTARVLGRDVVGDGHEVRRLIGLSGQHAAVDDYLTGRENLSMIGRLSGLTRASTVTRVERLLDLFDLTGVANRTVRTYSGGMLRRLDVAASLVASPPLLFLDEPTTGLDPRGRAGLWSLLEELAGQGTSVLLTTQYLEEADRLADTIVVMDEGRLIASGTAADLKSRVGGDRLELQVPPGHDPALVATAMEGLGSAAPAIDVETGKVVVPIADGPGVLADVAARLISTGVGVSDLAFRRPSLDDVFLTLTGQHADRNLAGGGDR